MTLQEAYERKFPLFGPVKVKYSKEYLREAKETFYKMFESPFPYNTNVKEFKFIRIIGKGAYGKVILSKKTNSKSLFAIKALKKRHIVERKEVKATLNEKLILQSLDSPFCIRLLFSCQDNSFVYFVMPFMSGGSVFTQLQKFGRFNEDLARFYACQVVLGFEYLHYLGLVYRDLKPENLLVDHLGYLRITDFGFSKVVRTKTYTFCGTPEYIAPEIIKGRGHDKGVDWWALGVLIYEMSAGRSPFFAESHLELFKRILRSEYFMPNVFSEELKDIVKKLLVVDVTRRLGNLKNGPKDVKIQKWFNGMDWKNLLRRKLTPPMIPTSSNKSLGDVKSFKKLKTSHLDNYAEYFSEF